MFKMIIAIMLTTFILAFHCAKAQVTILYEGFESGVRPSGWTEQKDGPRYWRYEDGGYASTTGFRHPPSAYAGNYNALFQDESDGPTSRLITPPLDLRASIKPVLLFWHAQNLWGANDELTVSYRLNETSDWVDLEVYLNPILEWTQHEILLPDETKVQTCQLGFMGKSNWGWGVCIDEINLIEQGVLPRMVESFTLKQTTSYIPTGSDINPVGYLSIFVSGNDGSIPLNSMIIDYSGSSITDVTDINLFFTKDSIFSITSQIQSDFTILGNQITVEAPTFSLSTGDNFIWICFDVSSSANHSNTIDFSLAANSVDLGGTTFPSTFQSPSGKGLVEESILFDSFENINEWDLSGNWSVGIQTGTGTYDPTYAYSGEKVLATNLSGNYARGVQLTNPHRAISKSVNAKFYKDLRINYKRWLNFDYFDRTSVKISNDNEVSWNLVTQNYNSIFDRYWRSIVNNIGTYATRKENVKIMISIDTTNNSVEYGGWNIDNFAITGNYIAQDVGILNMVAPIQECGLTDNETVKVTIKNFGGEIVSSPFEVGYSLNNGVTWEYQTFSSSLNSEQEVEFPFTVPANFSSPGLKSLKFKTILIGDEDATNDVYSKQLYVFPAVSYPYQTSFETSTAHWYPSGTNLTWQWGNPAGTILNKASDGTKAWVTGLASVYKNGEFSYLESPCFDLSTSEYPVIAFDYMLDIEENNDGFAMEYSIDGGLSWDLLPQHAGYAHSWYDTDPVVALGTRGWNVNQTEYVTAKNLLPDDAKVNGAKFRFVFASNETDTLEGVAIDNIRVYELPYDVGVTALVSPADACEIGEAVKLQFELENFGYRPLPLGAEIPLMVSVNDSLPVSETITLSAELTQTQTVNFETDNSYNLFAAQWHDIVAYTSFEVDDDFANDTLSTQVEVYGMPGYTLGPDVGSTVFPVTLDAGAGYVDYDWTTLETTQTIDIADPGAGISTTVSVTVENNRGCTANDEISVWNSDKNVGVTAILNLSSACDQPIPVSPQVTLKNFGPGVYDGVESFPVVVMIDSIEVLEENYQPSAGWGVDATHAYTFIGTIDLSEVKPYDIRIYTKLAKDLAKTNDTTKVNIITYGLPVVTLYTESGTELLELDSISTTRADTLFFSVDNIFNTYAWERKIEGTSSWESVGATYQLDVNTLTDKLRSAWYRITVTDVNACGTDKDSIYVNAKDLGVFSIDNPQDTVCFHPDGEVFSMRIMNYGQDTYPIGSEIDAVCITPEATQEVTITTESELSPGNMITVDFPELVSLTVGQNFVRLSTSIQGDPNSSNDFKEMLLVVKPSPMVNIEPDTLFQIFREEIYEISPEYSPDCVSYLWQDFSVDSLNYAWATSTYEKYIVVTENDQACTATDSIVIISNDLAITAIKSPVSNCELQDNLTVTFTLLNNGNKDYLSGEKINVNLFVNGTDFGSEEVTLGSDLLAGESRDISLVQKLDLAGFSSANILIEIETSRMEVLSENNTLNRTVYELGYPTPSLGENREVHAYEEVLDPGYYESYTWNDASTNQMLTVTQSGTYSVTVTDFSGCQGSDEVTLTFYVDDLSVISFDEPVSQCDLTSEEPVKITIKNTGTWTIPADSVIQVGFIRDAENDSEDYTLLSPLAPNQTLQIALQNTMDLSVRKTHNINAWVALPNDMVEENNDDDFQVTAYTDVLVEFGSDTIFITGPYELDAGVFFTYDWSTGATSQTIDVIESGKYWVDVFNEQGCTDNDTVIVQYTLPDLRVFDLVSPVSDCSLPQNSSVTLQVKNMGQYVYPAEDSLFLTLWFNSNLIAEDTLVLEEELALNQTINYTFSETLNLSTIGSYEIKTSVHHSVDANSLNDTVLFTVNHWGFPTVSLGDDFTACSGDNHAIDAGNTGATFFWNTEETTQTITPTETGTYSVVVTDENQCETSDEINVTIKPSPETSLDEFDPVCSNDEAFDISGGTPAGGVYSGTGVSNGIFNPLSAGAGTHAITYTVTGENGCSTAVTSDIIVNLAPTVNLGDDQTITSPLILDPGFGFVSYLWQDESTNQTFTANQSGTYYVTVVDENGCIGYDEINITYIDPTHNVIINELVSPVNVCNEPTLPVQVNLRNDGQLAINSGDSFNITYQVAGQTPVNETVTLTSSLPSQGTMSYTFDEQVTLSAGSHSIYFWTSVGSDASATTTHTAVVLPTPNLNIGPDTLLLEDYPYTLMSGVSNVTYLWSTGNTNSYITVTEMGTYWLTVTGSNLCQASDTIYIHAITNIGTIPGTNIVVNVFPNPAKENLNFVIYSETPNDYLVEVFSPLGRKVHQTKVVKEIFLERKVDVSTYSSGVYLVRVSSTEGQLTFKVVIQK